MDWVFIILIVAGTIKSFTNATCVFESDFGFALNCAFKKSGLFRLRNLGGVKGYVGLGFSVGDELGFAQALSNLESDRRRSADGPISTDSGSETQSDSVGTGRSDGGWRAMSTPSAKATSNVGAPGIPPFKPIAPSPPNSGSVPAFQALPESIARIPTIPVVQRTVPQAFQTALNVANRRFQIVVSNSTENSEGAEGPSGNTPPTRAPSSVAEAVNSISPTQLATRTLSNQVEDIDIGKPSSVLNGHSVQSLAEASNISVEALSAALRVRQQYDTTTVPSTTKEVFRPQAPTVRPKYSLVGPNRVMNAPKEYYPISYDKNYDDNFASKVELPDTSFSCGDQKHFPGLYADEDLGCMVFHVCAFTDDGLVMKSFLCPESTLFDQTVLKCNWWFYVDCKSSKKLYDSNIPISKSYQLMKALAFFSAYKSQNTTNSAT